MPSIASLSELNLVAQTEVSVTYHATVDPVFTIGPKVHGGSLQAMAAQAALNGYAALSGNTEKVAPLAITSDYLSAPDPTEIEIVVTASKLGRRISLLDVDVKQNGRSAVRSRVTVGVPDSESTFAAAGSVVELSPEPSADSESASDGPMATIFNVAQVMDLLYQPSEFAGLKGEIGIPTLHFWARPKEGDLSAAFVVMCGDISPPVVLNVGQFGWAPTLQLSTYLRRTPAPGWLRVRASSNDIGNGMFIEDHIVVDSLGAVVLQSRQLAMTPGVV